MIFAFQFCGVASVPFHPDESTQLFMSGEFRSMLRSPGKLAWQAGVDDRRAGYRLLDAPLSRYLFGLGLALARQDTLPVDWDWSRTWDANRAAGALPGQASLETARLAATSLIPLSVLFVLLTARSLGGRTAGILAGVLLGVNALVLLHARRAMAESALLLGVSLSLWGFLQGDRHPWLAGLGAALAFNAKQSALAIAPVGLLAVVWLLPGPGRPGRKRLVNAVLYCTVFLAAFFLLNPYLWKNPLAALQASWEARQELLARQVGESLPDQVQLGQQSLLTRSGWLAAQLFLLPPEFFEVGNYRADTGAQQQEYLSTFGHQLGRGLVFGGVLLILALVGILYGFTRLKQADRAYQRSFLLVFLAMLFQLAGLLIWVPLPWQRYVIPLVPYACIWPAIAVVSFPGLRGRFA